MSAVFFFSFFLSPLARYLARDLFFFMSKTISQFGLHNSQPVWGLSSSLQFLCGSHNSFLPRGQSRHDNELVFMSRVMFLPTFCSFLNRMFVISLLRLNKSLNANSFLCTWWASHPPHLERLPQDILNIITQNSYKPGQWTHNWTAFLGVHMFSKQHIQWFCT